jgi:hypothetical protein
MKKESNTMIRVIAGPPEFRIITETTTELLSVKAMWRDPQSGKADKATTVTAIGKPGAAERWLVDAVARMAEHVGKASGCRCVVEC